VLVAACGDAGTKTTPELPQCDFHQVGQTACPCQHVPTADDSCKTQRPYAFVCYSYMPQSQVDAFFKTKDCTGTPSKNNVCCADSYEYLGNP